MNGSAGTYPVNVLTGVTCTLKGLLGDIQRPFHRRGNIYDTIVVHYSEAQMPHRATVLTECGLSRIPGYPQASRVPIPRLAVYNGFCKEP